MGRFRLRGGQGKKCACCRFHDARVVLPSVTYHHGGDAAARHLNMRVKTEKRHGKQTTVQFEHASFPAYRKSTLCQRSPPPTTPLLQQRLRMTVGLHRKRMPPLPPKPSRPLPLIRSPRLDIRQPPLPVPEPLDAEVCEPNDRSRVPDRPRPFAPKPSRDLPPKPAFRAKTELMDRDDGPLLPSRNDPSPKLPAKQITTDFKRPKIPIPHFLFPNRPADKGSSLSTENAGSTDTEKEEDLYRKSWYAGDCDRKTAEDALMRSNKDGSFLVRQSSGQDVQQPYTLVVLYNDRVYNIPVRFIPATMQYALGREKKGEELFSSVSHMIDSHQRNPLVLIDTQSNNKDATKLLYAVRP